MFIAEDLTGPMTEPILIDDLTFAYDTHDVLNGLSLRVPAGATTTRTASRCSLCRRMLPG